MMRVTRKLAFMVLFSYLFALVGPVGVAWADTQDEADVTVMDDEDGGDDDEGISTPGIIGAVLGAVVGGVAGVALGPVGIIAGGGLGLLLGKWIGNKLDEKSLGDRASDNWNSDDFPGKYWWKNRWYDVEDWWQSDDFAGKYWWKDKWERAKFWEDDDDDEGDDEDEGDDPSAPGSVSLSSLRATFHEATKTYQDALAGSDDAAKKAARLSFEAAQQAYFSAKAAASSH